MFVTEMNGRGPRLFRLDLAGSAVESENIFLRRIINRIINVVMAIGALATGVVIMALETYPHHHVLVFDIRLLISIPDAGAGIVSLLVAGMALCGSVGHAGVAVLHVIAVIGPAYCSSVRPLDGANSG